MKFWSFRDQMLTLILTIGTTISQGAIAFKYSLPVPVYGQLQDTWCWAATDQMVRARFNDFTAQCNIVTLGLNPPGGRNCCDTPTHSDCLHGHASILSSTGYTVQEITSSTGGLPLSFPDMKSQIAFKGRPIIATVGYSGGSAHQVVVRGVTLSGPNQVGINNPAAGGDFVWMSYESFLSGPGYNIVREYINISKNP